MAEPSKANQPADQSPDRGPAEQSFAAPPQPAAATASTSVATTAASRPRRSRKLFGIRKELSRWQVLLFSLVSIAICGGLWWFLTGGEPTERIISSSKLPSPRETFAEFRSLWFDRGLTRNTFVSLRRLALGFGLAAAVGIPLGVLCGCFTALNAFFLPITLFGRNIPVAALIPLTYSLFGIGEEQKVMFIFIACVAFIISDTANAVQNVGGQYIDTAYTLGASRWQVIMKVLVPLALSNVMNSLRLLFGLAFGYIMLAELIKLPGTAGGLGDIIITSQRRGPREHIYLVLLIIPIVALAIDRVLFWIQRELFPHQYGGTGMLNQLVRTTLHAYEDVKNLLFRRRRHPALPPPAGRATGGTKFP
jgi:NitT/TauT family transport system permease protein